MSKHNAAADSHSHGHARAQWRGDSPGERRWPENLPSSKVTSAFLQAVSDRPRVTHRNRQVNVLVVVASAALAAAVYEAALATYLAASLAAALASAALPAEIVAAT